MKVLLSIKPEFANKIFTGEKKFEYRKSIFKRPVTSIVVYSSSPVQRVIGEFIINGILYEEVRDLWNQTRKYSGISETFYHSYFSERKMGYAIRVGKVTKYKEPKILIDSYGVHPPQSFVYLL